MSVNDAGVEGNGASGIPSISADGHYVTFASLSSNLVAGDNNLLSDVFVYDTATKKIQRVSVSAVGVEGNGVSNGPSLSANGRYVSFNSTASNLVPGHNNGLIDIFVYDTVTKTIQSVSISDAGVEGNGDSGSSSLSADGRYVTFQSLATNLVPGDDNTVSDIFVCDRTKMKLEPITYRPYRSVVDVSHTTVAYTSDLFLNASVFGDVQVNDSLFVANEVSSDIFSRLSLPSTGNVFSATPQSGLITSLQRSGTLPPVHHLIAGNPAVDSASPTGNGTLDQLGQMRVVADVGAVEAIKASASGKAYVDSDRDGRLDQGEAGLPGILVNVGVSGVAGAVIVSGSDNPQTPLIDETGILKLTGLTVGTYEFSAQLISGWSIAKSPLKVIRNQSILTNADSSFPSLCEDGRYVTFQSSASNLVPGDSNNQSDIFVCDSLAETIQRVSVSDAGVEGNQTSDFITSLSADGRYVTFQSAANNLVPGDTNNTSDIFVYDIIAKTIIRASVSDAGVEGNSGSYSPSLSADGHYVTFQSSASNLVSGYNNTQSTFNTFREDAFVYDRQSKMIRRVSISDAGVEGNNESHPVSLSSDGHFVTFSSFANNLVDGDINGKSDIFIVSNPLVPAGVVSRNLKAGDAYTDLNFGLVPNPGTIRGRIFQDDISNDVFDAGESAVGGAIVFLDLDSDRLFDAGEQSVTTAADGTYQFLDTDSYQSYSIVLKLPIGFEQVAPGDGDNFSWNIFLPAGGVVTDRDFAIQHVQSTGQSSASAVSGRLFDDRNGNGVYNAGVDLPIVGREIYLDATNFGVRDTNEPRKLTDADGMYSLTELSSRNVAVTTTLDDTLVHVSPLGSNFGLQKYPLFSVVAPFGNPQSIAAGDFNADGFSDVAVALGEGNKLSIRINDKAGGFLSDQIDLDLGSSGAGPTSLVVGQFDNNAKLDVALAANFAGNVTVLLNYDSVSKSFALRSYVKVGNEPLDIAAGQFVGDAKPDLVVVNKADNTVQLLSNNGSGAFTAGTAIASGGNYPVSIVVGNFTGDASLDVAVVHAVHLNTTTTSGGVTVLKGNGAGTLTKEAAYYQVGALPIDSVTADFNGDGRADLAVANFSSNSISMLLGKADGTFRVQTSILGTASGAFDIAVADVDNDGDMDVIASNLKDRNISIFRNIGVDTTSGDVKFEPLENLGLGEFALAQRMPLVVANFDNDTTGPSGTGTVDIVTIPQETDTLHVLKNKLVNDAPRRTDRLKCYHGPRLHHQICSPVANPESDRESGCVGGG